jgi:hypothetical protein
MKALFDKYELALKSCGEALDVFKSARDEATNIVNDIVKKMQAEKGYVKFAYGHRPDLYGDVGEITYIRYNYERENLQFLRRADNVKPESKKVEWLPLWLYCSYLDCYERIIYELKNIAEK